MTIWSFFILPQPTLSLFFLALDTLTLRLSVALKVQVVLVHFMNCQR